MLACNDAMTQPATAKPEFCVHMQLSHAGPGLVRSLIQDNKLSQLLPLINDGGKIYC